MKLLLVLDGERLPLPYDSASVAACVWDDDMPRVASPDLWEAEHGLDVGINGIDESTGSKVRRGAWGAARARPLLLNARRAPPFWKA